MTPELFTTLLADEMRKLHLALGAQAFDGGRFIDATRLFSEMSLAVDCEEFLTLPAYELLD